MIDFEKIRFKNFMSYGNQFAEIDFKKASTTMVVSGNGGGKCLRGNTYIEIEYKTQHTIQQTTFTVKGLTELFHKQPELMG